LLLLLWIRAKLSVPKVDNHRKPTRADGAAAFWSVATALEASVTTRGFTGDLTSFGFLLDQSSENLARMRDAISVASDVGPDLNPLIGSKNTKRMDHGLRRLRMWEKNQNCRFWSHPFEETLAITMPFSFAHPYGDAAMVLINFEPVDDKAQQNRRNENLAALDAAKHSTRENMHMGPIEAYIARGGIFGGTFAFAKHSVVGARDRLTTASRGFSMSKGDAKYNYSSANMPFLFLEISFEEIAV